MPRFRRSLGVLALLGWLGALVSKLAALVADDGAERAMWRLRAKQFLLVSSAAMNTLVLTTAALYARRLLRAVAR